jgi:hypothetical protein
MIMMDGEERTFSIRLCQQPEDVIAKVLPKVYQADSHLVTVLTQALLRLRDNLRMHVRPWVFQLQAGETGGKNVKFAALANMSDRI